MSVDFQGVLFAIVIVVQLLHFQVLVFRKTELKNGMLFRIDFIEVLSGFAHGEIGLVGELNLKHLPLHPSVDPIELIKVLVPLLSVLLD